MTNHSNTLYAIFGGTFDPIHNGHLIPATTLADELNLQHIILLPNHVPPHRPQPEASPQQRLEMLKLAVQNNPLFSIDTRELNENKPSYTIDTLHAIRQEVGPHTPLGFIIGLDSLLTIHTWHRWNELLDYCHLLVCARPGYQPIMPTTELESWLQAHLTTNKLELTQTSHEKIYLANTPLIAISATEIRQHQYNKNYQDDLLPKAVQNYINEHALYC